jgi:hypothetical protein
MNDLTQTDAHIINSVLSGIISRQSSSISLEQSQDTIHKIGDGVMGDKSPKNKEKKKKKQVTKQEQKKAGSPPSTTRA